MGSFPGLQWFMLRVCGKCPHGTAHRSRGFYTAEIHEPLPHLEGRRVNGRLSAEIGTYVPWEWLRSSNRESAITAELIISHNLAWVFLGAAGGRLI
jgi:hypothetical protein